VAAVTLQNSAVGHGLMVDATINQVHDLTAIATGAPYPMRSHTGEVLAPGGLPRMHASNSRHACNVGHCSH
jgi:hypothetical protein